LGFAAAMAHGFACTLPKQLGSISSKLIIYGIVYVTDQALRITHTVADKVLHVFWDLQ